jgi:hypothetical protein
MTDYDLVMHGIASSVSAELVDMERTLELDRLDTLQAAVFHEAASGSRCPGECRHPCLPGKISAEAALDRGPPSMPPSMPRVLRWRNAWNGLNRDL